MARRLVLPEALPQTFIERDGTIPESLERVALIASFGTEPRVTLSLASLVREIEAAGYFAILVRASDDQQPLIWPEGYENNAIIVRRPNIGYDFGTWATAIALFPQVLSSKYVLVANDSLIGPFGSLKPMLDNFEWHDCDVWGATNTTQVRPHLQSYFLGFKNGVLLDEPLQRFWKSIEILDDKEEIIRRYEIGLSRLLYAEGYVSAAWFESVFIAQDGQNPSVQGWRRLLQLGFPFVKRQLLTIKDLVPDVDEVPETVRARYGQDVRQWM